MEDVKDDNFYNDSELSFQFEKNRADSLTESEEGEVDEALFDHGDKYAVGMT
jgi:hypothetical protein